MVSLDRRRLTHSRAVLIRFSGFRSVHRVHGPNAREPVASHWITFDGVSYKDAKAKQNHDNRDRFNHLMDYSHYWKTAA